MGRATANMSWNGVKGEEREGINVCDAEGSNGKEGRSEG